MFDSFYRIQITGRDLKRFLGKMIAQNLALKEVQLEKKRLVVLVDEDVYEKLKDMKTTYEITILNRYGKAKYQYLFYKYFFFLLALSTAIVLLSFLSNLILKVEVIHTKQEIRQLILTDLEEYGIKPYRFKVSFAKKEEITEKILNKEKEKLEWMEIEEVGTTYRVNVEERKKNTKEESKEEQSIVAKKSGRILEVEASHGEIVVKKNDYVKKGDILISGIIKNKETPVSKIRAEGSVFAEVWYKVNVTVPYDYEEKIKTGKKKHRLEIKFLNNYYTLFDFKPYKLSTKKRTKLLWNNMLPISIAYTTFEEIKIKEEIHNEKEAYQKAMKIAKEKLKSKLGVDDEIISQKTLKKYHKNSKIVIDVFFKVKENITDTISLKNIDLEDLREKEESE